MVTRNLIGQRFDNIECRKHGWSKQNTYGRAKFRLRDAIAVRFNPQNLKSYSLSRSPFIVKCNAIDGEGTPIEIKNREIITGDGNKLAILFSEHLSIKTYRDVYKLICEKKKINYRSYLWCKKENRQSKRYKLDFSELYNKHPEIIPLNRLKKIGTKRKQAYYRSLMAFCHENGVTDMFNNFVQSDAVYGIFRNWIQNFRHKNFYLACPSGIYHSSDLSFYVKPVKGYWGFDRMTVFVRLKKNV